MGLINLLKKGMINLPQNHLIFKIPRTNILPIVRIHRPADPKILRTLLALLLQNSLTEASLDIPDPYSVVFRGRTNIVPVIREANTADNILVSLEQKHRFLALQVIKLNILYLKSLHSSWCREIFSESEARHK